MYSDMAKITNEITAIRVMVADLRTEIPAIQAETLLKAIDVAEITIGHAVDALIKEAKND